jgi:hypothetical protein
LVDDTIQDVVERIQRYGDRERNIGNLSREKEAREAASSAQAVTTVEDAQGIEQSLLGGDGIVGQVAPQKKKSWFQRLFGGGDDDDDDVVMDNS